MTIFNSQIPLSGVLVRALAIAQPNALSVVSGVTTLRLANLP